MTSLTAIKVSRDGIDRMFIYDHQEEDIFEVSEVELQKHNISFEEAQEILCHTPLSKEAANKLVTLSDELQKYLSEQGELTSSQHWLGAFHDDDRNTLKNNNHGCLLPVTIEELCVLITANNIEVNDFNIAIQTTHMGIAIAYIYGLDCKEHAVWEVQSWDNYSSNFEDFLLFIR
jgi:hypothetical protein